MRARLLLAIGIAAACAAVLLDVAILLWMHSTLADDHATRAFTQASLAAAALAHSGAEATPAAADALLAGFATTAGDELLWADREGEIRWATGPGLVGRRLTALDMPVHYGAAPLPATAHRGLYVAPVLRSGSAEGFVGVMVEPDALWRRVLSAHKPVLVYLAIDGLLLLFVVGLIVERMFIRPLRRLRGVIARNVIDDPLLDPHRGQSDDVVALGGAVGQLTRQLRDEREQVREQVRQLHTVNDQLRRAETDLINQERLAAAGRLAAGIAHDIGNPLGIMQGYLELLDSASPAEARATTVKVLREIDRIRATIQELLEISRPIELVRAPLDLHRFLGELAERLAHAPRLAGARVELDLGDGEIVITGDRGRLERVLENVVHNAADAIAAAGRAPGLIRLSLRRTPTGLLLAIDDNGPGVPAAQRERVFDPFFSTKPSGKGTGLGLYVARQIVLLHGGTIACADSELGGLRIELALPRC